MFQARNSARLIAKLVSALAAQMRIEHLDGGQGIEMNMLSQVDISETAAPKQTKQAIITRLLSCAIGHSCAALSISAFVVFMVDVRYSDNCGVAASQISLFLSSGLSSGSAFFALCCFVHWRLPLFA